MPKRKNKAWKGIVHNWETVADMDTVDYAYYELNQRQVAILLAAMTPTAWETRWENLSITKDELEKICAEIQTRLMIEGECGSMPIDCGDIENCLETSPIIGGLNDAISGLSGSTSGGYNPENVTKPIENGAYFPSMDTPLNEPVNSCDDADKDELWGVVDAFVSYINSRNKSFASSLYLPPTSSDLLDRLFDIFPILQEMENTIISNFNNSLESIITGTYTSIVTNALLNEIKCDLFCAAVAGDCTFDIKQAFDYFADESIPSFSEVQSIQDAVIAIGDLLTLTPKELFCSLAVLQLSGAALGEFFTSQKTLGAYVNAAQSGGGNRAWAYLCDECSVPPATWTIVLDFMGNYSALAGEVVYRPLFDLLPLGSNPTGSSVTQSVAGCYWENPTNTNGVRRTIYTVAPFTMTQCQWKAKESGLFAGEAIFAMQNGGLGGASLPATAFNPTGLAYEESAVINQNAAQDAIGIIMNGTASKFAGSIAWLKIMGAGDIPVLA